MSGSSLLVEAHKRIRQIKEEETMSRTFLIDSDEQPKKLSKKERHAKILKYKLKLYLRRKTTPISKKFSGRSKVACAKLRVNGKFVKAPV